MYDSTPMPMPWVMLYVNGIALAVLELKRSTVSVAEGIRQNLDNQKKEFIQPFFSTMQLVMAGNDTEGLRYSTIETPEKYYLTWKEDSELENPLCRGDFRIDLLDALTVGLIARQQFGARSPIGLILREARILCHAIERPEAGGGAARLGGGNRPIDRDHR